MTTDTPAPRRTEYVRLAELKVNPRNPKSHNLEEIDASVKRFGTIDPIVRDDRTGYIISGHGRRETLTQMFKRGEDAPDGVLVNESGEWMVPVGVGWASRTDAEATAALIALNRTTELGGWVDDSLLDALDSLDDYSGVGFTEEDIEALRVLTDRVNEDGGERDLDALAEEYGADDEENQANDALRKVTLNLPRTLAEQVEEALADQDHAEVVAQWLRP
jgi:hypothetical protein